MYICEFPVKFSSSSWLRTPHTVYTRQAPMLSLAVNPWASGPQLAQRILAWLSKKPTSGFAGEKLMKAQISKISGTSSEKSQKSSSASNTYCLGSWRLFFFSLPTGWPHGHYNKLLISMVWSQLLWSFTRTGHWPGGDCASMEESLSQGSGNELK